MAILAVCFTASFLVHEMAHKVMAQKHGLWAEFRLTTWGAVITLASVFLPFKMISPGAMMIGGSPIKGYSENFSCWTNHKHHSLSRILCSSVLLPMDAYLFAVFSLVAYINAFMALFNLVPFGILDGFKIFSINKKVWAAAFIPSLATSNLWLLATLSSNTKKATNFNMLLAVFQPIAPTR